MDHGDWQLRHYSHDRKKRIIRKKNDAFRRQLEEQKAARLAVFKLRMVLATAVLTWAFAGIQYFR